MIVKERRERVPTGREVSDLSAGEQNIVPPFHQVIGGCLHGCHAGSAWHALHGKEGTRGRVARGRVGVCVCVCVRAGVCGGARGRGRVCRKIGPNRT